MTIDSEDVFMNGVKEDGEMGERCPLSMSNYGVGIGETKGSRVVVVMVGMNLRQVLMK
jgi:hypothetical protein